MASKLAPSGSRSNVVPRHTSTVQHQPIAIVGLSCRFAGEAGSASELWKLCEAGKSAWSPIPSERFSAKSFYHPNKDMPGRNHAVGGYFLDHDIASFDAGFFNLSADVASTMDPQLRILLESVYEATENAGIPLKSIAETNTSVFTGCWGKDYHELQARDPEILPASFLTGNGTAMLSNRISHFFDLQGASMSIDTGCSAGLVALHQACRSILWGDSDICIVTASSLMLSPDLFIALSNLSMTGADGKCYAWDSRAQGYGRGEGVATLILKPLDAAIRNGDHIHALVRETELNQDGKTKTLTSPSVASQARLIKRCYERAGLDLAETAYVEAHMTGTLVGDVAEAEALAMTFGESRDANDPVYVGCIKTNIGHTEPVSGLAAIIKTAWALKTRKIPPNLNYSTPNPKIPLREWNLRVPTSLTEWPKDKPLRASINNFGYGGTNAHVILEAAPEPSDQMRNENFDVNPRARIFVVSANDSIALKAMVANLANHVLTSMGDSILGDLAYTLSERRSRMSLVVAVRASSRDELASRFQQWSRKPSHAIRPPRLGFVFNGQGAQWHAMGRELISSYAVFGSAIERADEILRRYGSNWSLCDELMRDAESTRISDVALSQPITVALQLCLVDLLRSWGITPAAVASHSSGEIAAAYSAGRLSFDQALGVAYWRGELAFRNKSLMSLSGGMMAVRISSEDVLKYITDLQGGLVIVACINSPTSVTLSGDIVALEEVSGRLKADGFSPTRLNVPLAYHSHHMLSMGQEYTDHLKRILPTTPGGQWSSEIRFVSPVTGDIVQASEKLTVEHWTRNLTNPVLFSQALEKMCFAENGCAEVDMIVEIGAHSTLAGPIRQILKGREIFYAPCLQRSVDAIETMQNLACELVVRGYPVSLPSINSTAEENDIFLHDLPRYAWNHTSRYWTEPRISREIRHKKFETHELLGSLLPGDNGISPTWRNFLRLADIPWLIDYQVDSRVHLPTAAYIVIAIEAVRLVAGSGSKDTPRRFQLRDIEILDAVALPDSSAGVEIQLNLHSSEDNWYEFTLSSLSPNDNGWLVCCKGFVSATERGARATEKIQAAVMQKEFLDSETSTIDVDTLLSGLMDKGVYYGPAFRNITNITTSKNRSAANFEVSKSVPETHDYVIHPTTLDSVLQSTYIGILSSVQNDFVVLPHFIKTISVHSSLSRYTGAKLQTFTETQSSNGQDFTSTVSVINQDDQKVLPALHMDGFLARALLHRSDNTGQTSDQQPLTSKLEWELDAWNSIPPTVKDSMRITLGEQQKAFEKKIIRLSYYLINDAVRELESSSEKMQPHHNIFFSWMKEIVVLGSSGALAPRSKAWSRVGKGAKQLLVDEMNASENASARLTVRVGQNLARIVKGEISPLELMMEGNLLNQYYMEYPKLKDRTYKHLFKVARLLSIARPGANVLEIGAGTGGATKVVLEAFSPDSAGGSLVGHYTFTDVSSGFFPSARTKLLPWAKVMDFRSLNIEADVGDQEGSYDIIVASLVLHATKSLRKTMINVRKLLKPGGKLLLIETTTDRLDLQLVFGTLPGWWLSEEPDRKKSPNFPLGTWNKVLRETGFTGIEFDIGDCEEGEFQCTSLIVTSAAINASYPSSISLVRIGTPAPSVLAWFQGLGEAIRQRIGVTPKIESFDDVQDWNDKICVFAAEMDGPFVHMITQSAFEKLRGLLLGSRGLLWLSCGGTMEAGHPFFGETYGLLRTLRQEDASKRSIQLDFRPNVENGNNYTSDKIKLIVDVFQKSFDFSHDFIDRDSEYSVKDSMLYVPRLYPNIDIPETLDVLPLSIRNSDATYLIVGGVGSIGRAIVAWMVEQGAKYMLAVSRNAEKHSDVAELSAKAQASGCTLQFRSCDVSIEENFVKLLADCSSTLPPIRGVVNAAMILDDIVIERMTWDQWNRATESKVAISMHLHTHLPHLQFFILLSSVTGIAGQAAQANYAAGNTFQDALARYRTAQGQPAVVLDLSAIESVGWIVQQSADQHDIRKRIESLGAMSVSIDTVLSLLEAAIRCPLSAVPAECQVIVGLSSYTAIPPTSISKQDRRFGTLRLATAQATTPFLAEDTKDSMAILLAAVKADKPLALPTLTQLIVDAITNKLALIFNTDEADISPELPLAQYGIDSLVAVDLRNWLANRLKAKVSASDITQASSLFAFAAVVAASSELLSNLIG